MVNVLLDKITFIALLLFIVSGDDHYVLCEDYSTVCTVGYVGEPRRRSVILNHVCQKLVRGINYEFYDTFTNFRR